MLSRPVYEALPYVYITAGIEVIFAIGTPLAWLAGGLLYATGAYVWILRANVREREVNPAYRPRGMPRTLYEATPFLYLFAGLTCLFLFFHYRGEQSLPLTLAAAWMFIGAGAGSWLLRTLNRRYHKRRQPAR